ncbi:MAG: hypothetical protein OXU62_00100 [Gammaproteobacteria bacterium]|nr:hypothetical protein [Gammaproteobacteria bacterium]
MNLITRIPNIIKSISLCLWSFALVACGPSVRTATGDCYYSGKGILQLGATLLDSVGDYADTMLEQQYQRDQIELQRLDNKLRSINPETLRSESDITLYNRDVDRHNNLLEKIKDYQDRKEKKLKDGPEKSLSQTVDESGDCK